MSHHGHILVVDDERSMREFLEIFFEREGYKVTTAPGVDEAEVCLENECRCPNAEDSISSMRRGIYPQKPQSS